MHVHVHVHDMHVHMYYGNKYGIHSYALFNHFGANNYM